MAFTDIFIKRPVLSLVVSLSALLFAALIGVPLGAFMALTRFPGREGAIVALNAMMGLPPVVIGLAVFLALSHSGPLGTWGLLFTPQAMIIAQTIMVAPIIAALGPELELEGTAQRLYGAMRELEQRQVAVILTRCPDAGEGLGQAIRDRLVRAAGGQVIIVKDL